jgi:hypothetical protein
MSFPPAVRISAAAGANGTLNVRAATGVAAALAPAGVGNPAGAAGVPQLGDMTG